MSDFVLFFLVKRLHKYIKYAIKALQSSPHVSKHHLLLQYRISRPFIRDRLVFHCPLYVWQVQTEKEKLEWRKPESAQQFGRCCSVGSHSTCLIKTPAFISSPISHPLCGDRSAIPFLEKSLSHTSGCHLPFKQLCNQYLKSWPVSHGSWDEVCVFSSHTEDKNLPATRPKASKGPSKTLS